MLEHRCFGDTLVCYCWLRIVVVVVVVVKADAGYIHFGGAVLAWCR